MSASKKCSLILMSDDGRTRRLRLRAGVLRLLAMLWLLLAVAGGAGIWVGWEAWQYRRNWENDRYHLERELAESRVRLERLSNMEELYERSRMAVATAPGRETASPAIDPARASLPPSASTSETPLDISVNARATANATSSVADSPLPSADVAQPAGDSAPLAASPPEDQIAVDTGMVRVENVVARLDERRRLRVSVDLYNGDSAGQQISGQAVITLLDADGQEYPISSDDMLFRIVRFKKLVTSSTLPAAVSDAANAAIRVDVYVDDKLEFRRIYPVESR